MKATPFSSARTLPFSNSGLACDIDETLSHTAYSWMVHSIRLFGNPENLTPQQLVDKYQFSFNVPYWTKLPDYWERISPYIYDNSFQRELPVLSGALEGLRLIHEKVGVICYATARPLSVAEGTIDWLRENGFPPLNILMRPDEVDFKDGDREKVRAVASLFPKILGLIDDKAAVVNYFPSNYQGTIFHLGADRPVRTDIRVVPCKDWATLVREVSRHRNVQIDP